MVNRMKKHVLWILLVVITSTVIANESSWLTVAEAVVKHIDEAEAAYAKGDSTEAKRAVVSAYFGVFEDRKMEAAMRMELGAKHTYLVEKNFGKFRKAIQQNAGAEQVALIAEEIRLAMRRDALLLDQAGIPLTVFKVNQ
jgi:hypothetical protein